MAARSHGQNYFNNQFTSVDTSSTRSVLYDDLALSSDDEADIHSASAGLSIPISTPRLANDDTHGKHGREKSKMEQQTLGDMTISTLVPQVVCKHGTNEQNIYTERAGLPSKIVQHTVPSTENPFLVGTTDEVAGNRETFRKTNKHLAKATFSKCLPCKPGLIPDTLSVVPISENGTLEFLSVNSEKIQKLNERVNIRQHILQTSNNTELQLIDGQSVTTASKYNDTTRHRSNLATHSTETQIIIHQRQNETCESVKQKDQLTETNDDQEDFQIARFTPLVVNPRRPSSNCEISVVTNIEKRNSRRKSSRYKPVGKIKQPRSFRTSQCTFTRLKPELSGCFINEQGILMWICPFCKRQGDGSAMIRCDKCENWCHFACVGMHAGPVVVGNWVCVSCETNIYS